MGFKTRVSAAALTVCMALSALPAAAAAEEPAMDAVKRINVQGGR